MWHNTGVSPALEWRVFYNTLSPARTFTPFNLAGPERHCSMEDTMVRDKYTDKFMTLIESNVLSYSVASTRIEVRKLLKAYFMEQIADYSESAAVAHMTLEDNMEAIEQGRSL